MRCRSKPTIERQKSQKMSSKHIELEKLKDAYAKYIIEDADKIKNDISHPYVVTKKDVRMKRMKDFFNKFKKAIGL